MKNFKFSKDEVNAFNDAKIDRTAKLHNMLLVGNMGNGKTTIANCISRNTGETIYTMSDLIRISSSNTASFEDLVKAKILILDDLVFGTVNTYGNIVDHAQDILKERFDRLERYDNNYKANIDDLDRLNDSTEDKEDIEFLIEEARLKRNISNFDEARNRITIISTNLSLSELRESMGARLFDRFQKFFKKNIFTLNGTSYR